VQWCQIWVTLRSQPAQVFIHGRGMACLCFTKSGMQGIEGELWMRWCFKIGKPLSQLFYRSRICVCERER